MVSALLVVVSEKCGELNELTKFPGNDFEKILFLFILLGL